MMGGRLHMVSGSLQVFAQTVDRAIVRDHGHRSLGAWDSTAGRPRLRMPICTRSVFIHM